MKSSSVKRDEFSVVAWRLTGIQRFRMGGGKIIPASRKWWTRMFWRVILSLSVMVPRGVAHSQISDFWRGCRFVIVSGSRRGFWRECRFVIVSGSRRGFWRGCRFVIVSGSRRGFWRGCRFVIVSGSRRGFWRGCRFVIVSGSRRGFWRRCRFVIVSGSRRGFWRGCRFVIVSGGRWVLSLWLFYMQASVSWTGCELQLVASARR